MNNVTIKDYQDFLKKNNKLKNNENSTIYDNLIDSKIYNQYVKEAELLRQRQDAESRLSEQKASALRDHYVSLEKAEKKAEDIARMQGITTGASQSDIIDFYALGAAARAGIISNYESQKADLLNDYNSDINELKTDTIEDISEINFNRLSNDNKKKESEKTKIEADFKERLNQYMNGTIDIKTLSQCYKNSVSHINENLKSVYLYFLELES